MSQITKNHTIFIRTRNRYEWIIRYITLLQNFDYKGTLLIVDDSDFKNHLKIRDLTKNKYSFVINLERGRSSRNKSRVKRIYSSTLQGLMLIKTDYVSFCADDDFIFPDFITHGITFLESNPDYSTFIGPEIKVVTNRNLEIIKKDVKTWHSCELVDPLERLIDYFNKPTLAYIGVVRTSSFINKSSSYGIKLYSRKKLGYFHSLDEEIPWVSLCYIAGKVKYEATKLNGVRVFHPSADRLEQIVFTNPEYAAGPLYDFVYFDSRSLIKNFTLPLALSIVTVDPSKNITVTINKINIELLKFLSKQNAKHQNILTFFNSERIFRFRLSRVRKILFLIKHYNETSHLFAKAVRKYLTIYTATRNH